MAKASLCFIGAGNMATALVSGLIKDGYPNELIWVCDPEQEKLCDLKDRLHVNTSADNKIAMGNCDVTLFAVKPQVFKTVALDLADIAQIRKPLIMSVAAGIRCQQINEWLGGQLPIVRCMPNTPALVGAGAAGLFATTNVSTTQKEIAESIMRAVGTANWVPEEEQLDIVTALSGSGPAYFFYVMEAMIEAATTLGLSHDTARLLTLETALGAARMALESQQEIADLRKHVTSPGGTTEAALNHLSHAHLKEIFASALAKASQRAKELSK